MIDEYRSLVLSIEIQILSHALASKNCREQVKNYKFQNTGLKDIMSEIKDSQDNHYEPAIQALWDKYPIIYGTLQVKEHSNIKMVLNVGTKAKARIYIYDKFMIHLGHVAGTYTPLVDILGEAIHDLKTVRGRYYE